MKNKKQIKEDYPVGSLVLHTAVDADHLYGFVSEHFDKNLHCGRWRGEIRVYDLDGDNVWWEPDSWKVISKA
jgi:hypothetical protein